MGWEELMLEGPTYLVAEAGSGGTSLALHLARHCLVDGSRVLWAAPEMPDPVRFSQILGGLSLTASSRFHAMNLIGRMDLITKALKDAALDLPGVRLVVLDDWAPSTGRIPAGDIEAISGLLSELNGRVSVLLTAKPGTDMEAEDGLRVRSRTELEEAGCRVWKMTKSLPGRLLLTDGTTEVHLQPDDQGLTTL